MQRRADGVHGVALRHGGKEIGLALDGRGAAAAEGYACGHPAERIAQSHHGAAMQHAAPIAQILTHRQLGLGTLGRALEHVHAEKFGEGRQLGEGRGVGHCRYLVECCLVGRVGGLSMTGLSMSPAGCQPTHLESLELFATTPPRARSSAG